VPSSGFARGDIGKNVTLFPYLILSRYYIAIEIEGYAHDDTLIKGRQRRRLWGNSQEETS